MAEQHGVRDGAEEQGADERSGEGQEHRVAGVDARCDERYEP